MLFSPQVLSDRKSVKVSSSNDTGPFFSVEDKAFSTNSEVAVVSIFLLRRKKNAPGLVEARRFSRNLQTIVGVNYCSPSQVLECQELSQLVSLSVTAEDESDLGFLPRRCSDLLIW